MRTTAEEYAKPGLLKRMFDKNDEKPSFRVQHKEVCRVFDQIRWTIVCSREERKISRPFSRAILRKIDRILSERRFRFEDCIDSIEAEESDPRTSMEVAAA